MTVYVDDMRMLARPRGARFTARWSHMTADTEAQLHEMARTLGLRPEWVQHPGTAIAHYDLVEAKREIALRQPGVVAVVYGGHASKNLIRAKRAAYAATGCHDLVGPWAPAVPFTDDGPDWQPPVPATSAPVPPAPSAPSAAGLDFTAIDFETANHDRDSVCSMGLVRVRAGRPVLQYRTLVHPPGNARVHPVHRRIHHITEEMIAGDPGALDWPQACARLVEFTGTDVLVAHNAAFETSVIRSACGTAGLEVPALRTVCTVTLSRKLLPALDSHKLPAVLAALGVDFSNHHDALADAYGAAAVAVGLARRNDASDLDALLRTCRLTPRSVN